MKKAYLVLSNGKVFEGKRFGADKDTVGELVFTTGVIGYQENLTDPTYYGQIILQTFPLIGNYGINEDCPGKCFAAGLVVREWCDAPSNFRSQGDLDAYLKKQGIPGIFGIDTREVTRTIRENGDMAAMICDEIPADLTALSTYQIKDAVKAVAEASSAVIPADKDEDCKITLIDYGTKWNAVSELTKRGCTVTVLPYTSTAEEVLATAPDGILLSDGPGNPAENTAQIDTVKALIGKAPMMGISLGHQILALAMGGKCEKLHHGHRGGNQPVKDLMGTRTYMTTQNRGYTVLADSLQGVGEEIFRNVNDGTCEGLQYSDGSFSVQFRPEAANGPHDTAFLYCRFVQTVKNAKSKKAGEC